MIKEIQVGGKVIPMLSNAATPVYFRQVFGKDLLVFLQGMNKEGISEGFSETISELAYTMTKQADGAKLVHLSFDNYLKWLEDFGPLDFETASAEILSLYTSSGRTLSRSKKA